MAHSKDSSATRPQAVVSGDIVRAGTLNGRAGHSEFTIGDDGRAAGANPYELLSASLAACTAMTIRFQARRRQCPLSHVEVAVSYRRGARGHGFFERTIKLDGNLDDEQRAELMLAADMCPVGRTLALSAEIRTNEGSSIGSAAANYADDLRELVIPNIDPD